MSKSTPAPWSLDTCEWPIIVNGPDGDDETESNIVAMIHSNANKGRFYYDEEQAKANARVIEIAPLLYKLALEACESWPEFDTDGEVNGGDLVEWFASYRESLRIVLKKTEQPNDV